MTGHRREGSARTGHLGLCTDLYELRMAESYLKRDMTATATFGLFIRPSTARPWYVALGVERALELLETFSFGEEELAELERLVSQDHPGLDIVYELVEYDGRPRAKFSGDKSTFPGAKQVFRPDPPGVTVDGSSSLSISTSSGNGSEPDSTVCPATGDTLPTSNELRCHGSAAP